MPEETKDAVEEAAPKKKVDKELARRPWFREDGWLDASVDLKDFGLGRIFLRDAYAERALEYADALTGRAASMEITAKLLRAYVHRADGMTCPQRDAELEEWTKWIGGMRSKVVDRIVDGAMFFARRVKAKDDLVPN